MSLKASHFYRYPTGLDLGMECVKLKTYDVSRHTRIDHSAFVATISLDPWKEKRQLP